ncbi:ABC transporter ATP-binding protein [Bradyrhizobium sp. Arg237L]|uniref:ABC transporter ATP-binding protein n=1 Tax=Bradyrhizobium sp. Arg237L TaxID=3003352 RepID=UPI00249F91E6|nr:ABC transporter ATP-binding protein [Bradyrhizobium sp. Arg237L]MDI4237107.1 ABC transporter ATP-binding protein [Bradyrhizobium sp. Arg237L]
MTVVLETRALRKDFGALTVTNNVDFALEQGARHALIGPNGAGKTTFINLLMGNVAPSSGTVVLAGQEIDGLRTDQRIRRGLVRTFQINQLLTGLTVLENVQLATIERDGLGNRILLARQQQRRAAEEAYALLTSLGLADVALSKVSDLPYGRQRLVEVVIALALKPKVLLLDEPAAGVPPADSHRMLELIATMPTDLAVLIIEHDMELVFRFAHRITVLSQGAVLRHGTPKEIIEDPDVQAVYLGAPKHD